MPSVLISVSGDVIKRQVLLHSSSFVLLLAILAKLYVYAFFWGPRPKLVFCIFIFCNYLFVASSLL